VDKVNDGLCEFEVFKIKLAHNYMHDYFCHTVNFIYSVMFCSKYLWECQRISDLKLVVYYNEKIIICSNLF
jgi:hypothetical protein